MTSGGFVADQLPVRRKTLLSSPSQAKTGVAVLAGAVLIALSAQVSIPLGFTPVPLTGQTFAVLLVGAGLGCFAGALSVTLYVTAGGLGAPIYASHGHGWNALTSASGGYLIGFIAAAGLSGLLAERRWDRRFASSLSALLCGNVLIYAFGVSWLAHDLHLSTARALEDGLYPFIVGDLIKLYLAASVLQAAWRMLGRLQ